MSASAVAYDLCEAAIFGDTGAGGMHVSASPGVGAWVYSVQRFGDQQRTNNWPAIIIQIQESEESPMSTDQVVNLSIRFVIESGRDAADSFTKQNAVMDRLHTVFRRKVLTTTSDGTKTWSFTPFEKLGSGQNVPGGKTNQLVVPYVCVAKGT